LKACLSGWTGKEPLVLTQQFLGRETVFLVGGLNGAIQFQGAGLCPAGKESTARVTQMLASAPVVDLSDVFASIGKVLTELSTNNGGPNPRS